MSPSGELHRRSTSINFRTQFREIGDLALSLTFHDGLFDPLTDLSHEKAELTETGLCIAYTLHYTFTPHICTYK